MLRRIIDGSTRVNDTSNTNTITTHPELIRFLLPVLALVTQGLGIVEIGLVIYLPHVRYRVRKLQYLVTTLSALPDPLDDSSSPFGRVHHR
jgi:hypothetical protein